MDEKREARVVGQERAVDLAAVQVDQVAVRVGDRIAVAGEALGARAELRRDVLVPEQGLEPAVTARLIRQHVCHRGGRRRGLPVLHRLGGGAEGVALRAVHRDADVIGGLRVLERVRVGEELLLLG